MPNRVGERRRRRRRVGVGAAGRGRAAGRRQRGPPAAAVSVSRSLTDSLDTHVSAPASVVGHSVIAGHSPLDESVLGSHHQDRVMSMSYHGHIIGAVSVVPSRRRSCQRRRHSILMTQGCLLSRQYGHRRRRGCRACLLPSVCVTIMSNVTCVMSQTLQIVMNVIRCVELLRRHGS